MTNEELTILILDKLNWDYDKVVRRARANSTELLAGDLIFAVLEHDTVPNAAKYLNKGSQTLNRALEAEFVPLFGKLSGGNETWKYKFLSFVEYKRCSGCHSLKEFILFDIDNSTSDSRHAYCKICRKEHNATSNALRSFKRGSNIRIPKWANKDKIIEIYKNCPAGYQVDHIVPLQGNLVSGLHVENNLQYLSALDNIRKGNRFEV